MELDRRGADMLFQVLTASIAIASNESFSGWTKSSPIHGSARTTTDPNQRARSRPPHVDLPSAEASGVKTKPLIQVPSWVDLEDVKGHWEVSTGGPLDQTLDDRATRYRPLPPSDR